MKVNPPKIDPVHQTILNGEIIQRKAFLRRLYVDFYRQMLSVIENLPQRSCCVELGSGGGFIKEIIPEVITSDVLPITTVDKQFSAMAMPFEQSSLDAILMFDVFHHIPDVGLFLNEAMRCLKKGGKIVMIEPANTPFGSFIYRNFHHEPFEVNGNWQFDSQDPLWSANGALPWIVFIRDRKKFEQQYPQFKIEKIIFHTPLRYLLSGGLSHGFCLPGFLFRFITILEKSLGSMNQFLGLFNTIEITKI